MARRDPDESDEDSAALSHNPFGALASLRDKLPEGAPEKPRKAPRAQRNVVVRLEKKGREERELTIISGLMMGAKALETCLIELKEELGCRGASDDGVIYLQGDQRDRLRAALANRGISKVTIS